MQSGDITDIRHHTAEAGKDRSQTHHGVQSCDSLGQVGSSRPSTDDKT
jgi:hypothetical protein